MSADSNSHKDDDQQLDIIAVGAHPDDVEIACGGTLARMVQQGYRVGIIDLTDGEPTPLSPGPEVRLQEAKQAAEVLGVHKRITMELPNRRLFDGFEARVALAKLFRQYRPKVVLGFGDKTPLASPDHYQAMLITDAAVFYSRLCKWPDHFGDVPPHIISRQLYFQLAFEPMHGVATCGHITTDISDTLLQKLDSIRCYATQFPAEKNYVYDRVKAFAMHVGASAGYAAGEIFYPTRSLGTPDLMQALFPIA
jgi:LmbE family N-acetylglucosaminyl deacetylase